jgi:chemotaxis protein CheD
MLDEHYYVRISEMKVLRGQGTFVILGLGSCIGLFLRDPIAKVGGCAHVMLPDSMVFAEKKGPSRYADTAVPALLSAMVKEGADAKRTEAKVIGGANMFISATNPDLLPLGLRNVIAVREALRLAEIPLVAEDVGGNHGRTAHFKVEDGLILIKRVQQPDAWL